MKNALIISFLLLVGSLQAQSTIDTMNVGGDSDVMLNGHLLEVSGDSLLLDGVPVMLLGVSNTPYNFEQLTPLAVWTINHNLNRFSRITTTDLSGNEITGNVRYIDSNTIEVTFNVAVSGKAYLN